MNKPILLVLLSMLLVIITGSTLVAQPDQVKDAYALYKKGEFIEARNVIDQAVQKKPGKNSSVAWHIRGFVYKDLYAKVDTGDASLHDREVAIKSFTKSMELDKDGTFLQNNQRALKYLATTYYNDAVMLMRDLNPHTITNSEDKYLKYKQTLQIIDPNADFKAKDIDFYKAIATCCRKIYEADPKNRKDFYKETLHYNYIVLQLDSVNYGANYNTAVNIYNQGVRQIENMDPETDISGLMSVQTVSIKNFEQALPYALKAFKINPNRIETLKALRGIYYSLNEEDKAHEMDLKVREQERLQRNGKN